MARLSVLGFRAALTATLPADAGPGSIIQVDSAAAVARAGEVLNGEGTTECTGPGTNTTILLVSHPAGTEAIEVSKEGADLRVQARAQQGTQQMAHPVGACVAFEGLPDTPCDTADALCASGPALESLANCLAVPLVERFGTDTRLVTQILTQVCQDENLQISLARCIADDVGEELLNENLLLQRLLAEMLKWIKTEDLDALSIKLLPGIVAAVCASAEQRAGLASCLTQDILLRIQGDPALIALLRSLVTATLSANGIVDSLCASPTSLTTLANCFAGTLVNTFAGSTELRNQLRLMLVEVVPGSGLNRDAAGRVTFAYVPAQIVQAICGSVSDRAALADCLRPHLNIPPATNGAPIQISSQCAGSGPPMLSSPPHTIFVRIPDAGASAGNIGVLQCYGINGYPNLSYNVTSIQQFADGSKFVTFNSPQYVLNSTKGTALYELTANGIKYTGILTVGDCSTGYDGGA